MAAIDPAQQGEALTEPDDPPAYPEILRGKNRQSERNDDHGRTWKDDHGQTHKHDRAAKKASDDPPDATRQAAPTFEPRPPPPAEIPERHR